MENNQNNPQIYWCKFGYVKYIPQICINKRKKQKRYSVINIITTMTAVSSKRTDSPLGKCYRPPHWLGSNG